MINHQHIYEVTEESANHVLISTDETNFLRKNVNVVLLEVPDMSLPVDAIIRLISVDSGSSMPGLFTESP